MPGNLAFLDGVLPGVGDDFPRAEREAQPAILQRYHRKIAINTESYSSNVDWIYAHFMGIKLVLELEKSVLISLGLSSKRNTFRTIFLVIPTIKTMWNLICVYVQRNINSETILKTKCSVFLRFFLLSTIFKKLVRLLANQNQAVFLNIAESQSKFPLSSKTELQSWAGWNA